MSRKLFYLPWFKIKMNKVYWVGKWQKSPNKPMRKDINISLREARSSPWFLYDMHSQNLRSSHTDTQLHTRSCSNILSSKLRRLKQTFPDLVFAVTIVGHAKIASLLTGRSSVQFLKFFIPHTHTHIHVHIYIEKTNRNMAVRASVIRGDEARGEERSGFG